MTIAANTHKSAAFRVVLLQLALTFVGGTCVYFAVNNIAAISALTGGLTASIIQYLYSRRAFYTKTDCPHTILSDMIRAEIGKYVVVGLLLALLLKYFSELDALVLILSFVFITITGQMVSAWFYSEPNVKAQNKEN